ncbi:hypothetical protein BC938DRAFT_476292 [Jimgerdemannia flammicorona]|uniref:PRA1 family protein n=1 Tax=Jimgerdemannia flammicorona TaxID=994334 RepID=A0A433QQR5_9FUNG|nr:hypothetical protein BC938DRAFT_476292 [Jimgerdemannia flammicorona]
MHTLFVLFLRRLTRAEIPFIFMQPSTRPHPPNHIYHTRRPPGVFFLVVEQKNDYVRFHAWQSSLLFLTLMLAHFIIMFISSLLSWLLFFADIALVAWLGYRAYMDGASLERYEIPFFGALASQWVDSE